MPCGENVIPFGLDRLKIIEWLQALILMRDEAVCAKLNELEIPKLMLSLIKKYDLNSVLHLKVYNIFCDAVNSNNDAYFEAVSPIYLNVDSLRQIAISDPLCSIYTKIATLPSTDLQENLSTGLLLPSLADLLVY